jgi:hypothetical protein
MKLSLDKQKIGSLVVEIKYKEVLLVQHQHPPKQKKLK